MRIVYNCIELVHNSETFPGRRAAGPRGVNEAKTVPGPVTPEKIPKTKRGHQKNSEKQKGDR